nr:uncharacterized protein LOC109172462 [Ipomoea batatas]
MVVYKTAMHFLQKRISGSPSFPFLLPLLSLSIALTLTPHFAPKLFSTLSHFRFQMEPFNFLAVQRSILKFDNLKIVAKLFRLIELCLGLFLLAWSSFRLPFAVKISGEYFRLLLSFMITPLSIFVVSNFIVLTLLLKSGGLSVETPVACNDGETEFYELLMESSACCVSLTCESSNPVSKPDEIAFEDKRTIFVQKRECSRTDEIAGLEVKPPPKRTQSEKFSVDKVATENRGKLRRSETEKCRRVADPVDIPAETAYTVDELSNEEFNRTIEDFIAKQIKFHQEEKVAIVLHS